MIQFNEFKDLVSGLTDEIVKITKKYYNTGVAIEKKSDNSPVTLADQELEVFLRGEIQKRYPEHLIIGEEFGQTGKRDSLSTWTIDPIDGTYSFIHGIPLFTTLISYCYDSKPVYGMIFQPISGELVIGSENGTFYNGKPAKMCRKNNIKDATILTTSTTNIEKLFNGEKFRNLSLEARTVRTWGDGYGYVMLVSNRADVMIDPKMKHWDMAPLIPIIKGAGGIITDYKGNKAEKGNSIIASANRELHEYVLLKLN